MARVKCPKCFTVNPEGQERCTQCQNPLPRIRIEAQPTPPPPGDDAGEAELTFRRGQIVANRYSVLNIIGRGGMGCIYKVHDNVLGESVALKTLLPQFLKDKMVVERFFNEAKIARKLAHPNVVRVHDIGSAGKLVYISMEYLQGKSLRALLESQPGGRKLPLKQALRILDELCSALEYAHQFTIHRDIKPENIMIGTDGSVKLMDFGISKLMANTRMTGASVVMGTPFYMSPEQLRNSRDVDARADIFSVGVVLYEILAGNVPTGVPKPLSELLEGIPKELDAIVQRCVEPDPRDRFQSASELRQALAAVRAKLDNMEQSATAKPSVRERAPLPWRQIAGVGLVAAILLGMALATLRLEARRAGLLNAASQESDARPATPYEQIANLVSRLRRSSLEAAKGDERLATLQVEAQRLWERAEQLRAAGDVSALPTARLALQYFLTPLLKPLTAGMVFVPPGKVQTGDEVVDVGPFYMDATEVTVRDFAQFCRQVEGKWKEEFAQYAETDAELPVTGVTFYDAQAYAAWQRKKLPTDAQWARAAYGGPSSSDMFPWGTEYSAEACNCEGGAPATVRSFPQDVTWCGCFDMAGNVLEWTRTPANGDTETPDFGTPMRVRGGYYLGGGALPLRSISTVPFEAARPELGFRCVLEIPWQPEAVEQLLRVLGQ